jgi:hypothetical protein
MAQGDRPHRRRQHRGPLRIQRVGEQCSGQQGSKQEGPGRPWPAQAHAVAEAAGRGRGITGKNSAGRGSTALKKG